jgi:hypothetical protein
MNIDEGSFKYLWSHEDRVAFQGLGRGVPKNNDQPWL